MSVSNVLWGRLQEAGKPQGASSGFPEGEQLEQEGGTPPPQEFRKTKPSCEGLVLNTQTQSPKEGAAPQGYSWT